MLSALKNHPFAVEAFFKTSLVLTYAVPKEEVEHLIPDRLTLDAWQDKWAFVAIALVQTKDLRPKGFPAFMGSDFILAGYRVFVRYRNSRGRNLRGLYILQSRTNSPWMTFGGNIFTHYNYQTSDIDFGEQNDLITVASSGNALDIKIRITESEPQLPSHSPFKTWKEARRFSGPLPFTFTVNEKKREVLIIEGVRQHWTPKPVKVERDKVGFISNLNITGTVLANAFIVQDVPYYWKKGVVEQW
jgi:hypothetical protein